MRALVPLGCFAAGLELLAGAEIFTSFHFTFSPLAVNSIVVAKAGTSQCHWQITQKNYKTKVVSEVKQKLQVKGT